MKAIIKSISKKVRAAIAEAYETRKRAEYKKAIAGRRYNMLEGEYLKWSRAYHKKHKKDHNQTTRKAVKHG